MRPPLSPITTSPLGPNPILNKRFLRITFISFSLLFVVGALIWHEHGRVAEFMSIPSLPQSQNAPKDKGQSHEEEENDIATPVPKPDAPAADAPKPDMPEFYPFTTTSSFRPVQIDPEGRTTEELCASFPKHLLARVQPVLKMGHGEKSAKIESQFDSVSACFNHSDLLIFSDLEESVRGHDVIDILGDLPATYYNFTDNPDFESYELQHKLQANNTLDTDKEATSQVNGWILDKYKFLPIIERTWKMRPNKDFYFFFETDTYVFWDNVFRFLETLDPDHPHYMGSPSPGRHDDVKNTTTWFANGGPGYALSRGAIKALLHRKVGPDGQYIDPPLADKWLPLLRHECCGDSVLGWAFWNVDVPLQGYWPLFNPHPLDGLPFSDDQWCQPVLTLHKTVPAEMVDVWKWEFSRRELGRPLLYSDLWKFHQPGQNETAENWDNGDWGCVVVPPEAGIESFDACKQHCEALETCLQFNFRGRDEKKCIVCNSVRLGSAREPEAFEEKDAEGIVVRAGWKDFQAGWMTERIQAWRENRTCDVVEWVRPSITRIF